MTSPDIDALNTYGGALANYAAVEDPTTDRDATAMNQALCSVAMSSHTTTKVWMRVVGNGAGTPTAALTNAFDAVWLAGTATVPTYARTSAGLYTITLPATVNDELGVAHTINLKRAGCTVEGAVFIPAQAEVTSPNVITLHTFNTSGTATDIASTVTVHVWAA